MKVIEKRAGNKNNNNNIRVRAVRCLALIFFATILIFKTTIFATPSTVYDLSKSGYYRIEITNSLSHEWARYHVKVNILDTAYSDTQYNVSYEAF